MNEETVSSFFEHDHERLDEIFESYRATKGTAIKQARERFRQFKEGLLRHIGWEERILFPSFEEKIGFPQSGPTHVMRSEHRQIERQLGELERKIDSGVPSSDEEDQLLLNLLFFHNRKEERILYPAIDRTLSEEGLHEVFEKIHST